MRRKHWIVVGAATLVITAIAAKVWADALTRTFRTTTAVGAVYQSVNPLSPTTPAFGFTSLAGHDLVNMVLGTPLTTPRTNEVLALDLDCAGSQASLVVFDKASSSNIATIATSTSINWVVQQDNPLSAAPNRGRFVTQMDIGSNNFLVDGFLTIAGRVHLDPETGCPQTVLKDIDRKQDKFFADGKVKNTDDVDKDKHVAGFAHVIGVADVLFEDGSTNSVLLPFGRLNMRRQLAP
jgi:hypothetical protein